MYKKKKNHEKYTTRRDPSTSDTEFFEVTQISKFRKWAAIEGGDETGVERKRANVEGKRERGIK